MKRVIASVSMILLITALIGCLRLFPDKLEPPEWLWGTWEGYFSDTSELSESIFWTIYQDHIKYGYADGGSSPVFYDSISGYKFDDGYSITNNGEDQYSLELVAGTDAYRKYVFTKVSADTVELIETRSNSRQYKVILTRKR